VALTAHHQKLNHDHALKSQLRQIANPCFTSLLFGV